MLYTLLLSPSFSVRPVILLTPALITFNQGDTVTVNCEATGIPSPEVSWFRNSVLVPDSEQWKQGNK
mgnify:CR=1 FL=1